MSEPHYIKKISPGGKVSYQLYAPPDEPEQVYADMTNKQLVTIAATLGVIVMYSLERNVQLTPLLERRIRSYRLATHELVKGTGHIIDNEVRDHVMQCWDLAMTIAELGTDTVLNYYKYVEKVARWKGEH